MSRIHEELSARFREWEVRTRGSRIYAHPVPPEPPFVPFPGHHIETINPEDDGRKPTLVSSLFHRLWSRPPVPVPEETEAAPEPEPLEREALVELPLVLPDSFDTKDPVFEAFTRSLYVCQEPLGFEILGTPTEVTAQLAIGPTDYPHVRQQLKAFFPGLVSTPAAGRLENAWAEAGPETAVVEFGLANECVLPLASPDHDAYVALAGALGELSEGECGLFQVLWQSLDEKWADSLIRSVTDPVGKDAFVDAPELAGAVKNKTASPLYAAVVRLAACSDDFDRSWDIIRRLAGGLRAFAQPGGNLLVPFHNDGYPFEAHVKDLLKRQSRRAGMVLNAEELLGLVHLPSSAVRSPKFRRQVRKSKKAPAITTHADGLLLGENEHAGEVTQVRLTRDQRRKHMHVIGASGTGKTTLLYNLIRQDIEAGEGLAVLDPHGDLIDRILGIIPPSRINDVVLLDPGDEEFSIGFNILSAHSDLEKNLLASDLVSVFQRLSTSWGDQMGIVLSNAIRAFLESDKGGTLADLRRFLLEPTYRDHFLETVKDPDIVYYWKKGFAQLTGNKSIGPVMTRLETFLSPKPIRYMVSQTQNKLDFADIMDGGKIFLAKLSQGAIGKENSYLLGSLLLAKFQQIAMGRQRMEEKERRDFWLYLDEFHNFITPSTAEILTGARKYRIGLALAHQELRQLQRDQEVASAVLANPYTRVCFRVGDQDARQLEHGLSAFEARDLQNLGTFETVCRVERSDYDFNLRVFLPQDPGDAETTTRRKEVTDASRARYGTPRAAVEAALHAPLEEMFEMLRQKELATRAATRPKPTPAVNLATPPPLPPPLPPAVLPAAARVVVEPAPAVPIVPPKAIVLPAKPSVADRPPLPPPVDQLVTQPVSEPMAKPSAEEATAKSAIAELGRGGAQHKAIQHRIKEAAEALGFRVHVEKSVLEGSGSVDLVLEREPLKIACEVTVTQTLDYEIGNIRRSFKAGFAKVAMVGTEEQKLAKIRAAVLTSLGAEVAAKVTYHLPDEFIAYLTAMPAPSEAKPAVRKFRGRKVTTTYAEISPEERRAREHAQIELVADLIRKKQP